MNLRALVDEVWPTLDANLQPEAQDEARTAKLAAIRSRFEVDPADGVPEVLLFESRELFKEEEGRRARVDAKAAGLLAAIGLSVSFGSGVLFAALRVDFPSYAFKRAAVVALTLSLLSLVYLGAAAFHTLRALSRSVHSALGPEDLAGWELSSASQWRMRLAKEYALCALVNRSGTNAKVDNVHMAQLFVRNAVLTIVLVAFVSVVVVGLAPVRIAPSSTAVAVTSTTKVATLPIPVVPLAPALLGPTSPSAAAASQPIPSASSAAPP